jgi:hypothetical protein
VIDVKIAKFYIIGLLARDIWESCPFQTKAEFFTTIYILKACHWIVIGIY